jgi:hypothetical protein
LVCAALFNKTLVTEGCTSQWWCLILESIKTLSYDTVGTWGQSKKGGSGGNDWKRIGVYILQHYYHLKFTNSTFLANLQM